MKQIAFVAVCLSMLLFACTSYEKENQRLNEELKMVRDENSYLKAEIVGLQKQLEEMGAKVKEERENLQKDFEQERSRMYEKLEEEREAIRKRSEEATKKSVALHKDAKEAPKNGQTRTIDTKAQRKPVVE